MLKELHKELSQKFSGEFTLVEAEKGTSHIFVPKEQLLEVCKYLKDSEHELHTLEVITGCDYPPDTIEVTYMLASFTKNLEVMLKVKLDRANPEVDSVVPVWNAANFQERECYDMVGVLFKGHPDLRRILCPDDWEGFPLRKDYEVAKVYNGMEVNPENKMNLFEREFAQKEKERLRKEKAEAKQ